MMVKVEPRKNRNNAKYNWEPVERDMVAGLSNKELSEKFSLPMARIRSRRREFRLKHAEMALLHTIGGVGDTRLPAPLPPSAGIVKSPPVFQLSEPQEPDTSQLSEDQLVELFGSPEAVLSLPPEALQKAAGRKFSLMLAEVLQNPPEARTLKDLATIHKLFREANGLDNKEAQGNGLLSMPRAFGRRAVTTMDAVVVREPEFPWPEGM